MSRQSGEEIEIGVEAVPSEDYDTTQQPITTSELGTTSVEKQTSAVNEPSICTEHQLVSPDSRQQTNNGTTVTENLKFEAKGTTSEERGMEQKPYVTVTDECEQLRSQQRETLPSKSEVQELSTPTGQKLAQSQETHNAVSYTHLTLPTIYSV